MVAQRLGPMITARTNLTACGQRSGPPLSPAEGDRTCAPAERPLYFVDGHQRYGSAGDRNGSITAISDERSCCPRPNLTLTDR